MTVRLGVAIGRTLPWDKVSLASFVWRLSRRQVEIFLEELIHCDGSRTTSAKRSSVLYCMPSSIRDQIQLLLVTNGYRVSQTTFRGNDHRLNICDRSELWIVTKDSHANPASLTTEQYRGEVWCLGVANGRFFAERNGKVFLTGNCFPKLHSYPIGSNGMRQITDNVWHLPRGFRWTWADVRFLALGGAHSVDRPYRVPGKSWWAEETITEEQAAHAISGGPADVLISHDCPAGVMIPGIDDRTTPPPFPPLEILRSNEHRQVLRRVVDAVQPRAVWHGHYHVQYEAAADFGYGPARVNGLDCDGGKFENNVKVVDLADLKTEVSA